MKELYTEIDINASPERVWRVLTEFDQYKDWNPFIKSIEGKPEVGTRLHVQMQPPGGRAMTFHPRVLRSEKNEELRWMGHLYLRGLFDGQHTFKIDKIDNGKVRFIQREKFNGILVGLFGRNLDVETRRGFKAMNEALKTRAEKLELANAS